MAKSDFSSFADFSKALNLGKQMPVEIGRLPFPYFHLIDFHYEFRDWKAWKSLSQITQKKTNQLVTPFGDAVAYKLFKFITHAIGSAEQGGTKGIGVTGASADNVFIRKQEEGGQLHWILYEGEGIAANRYIREGQKPRSSQFQIRRTGKQPNQPGNWKVKRSPFIKSIVEWIEDRGLQIELRGKEVGMTKFGGHRGKSRLAKPRAYRIDPTTRKQQSWIVAFLIARHIAREGASKTIGKAGGTPNRYDYIQAAAHDYSIFESSQLFKEETSSVGVVLEWLRTGYWKPNSKWKTSEWLSRDYAHNFGWQ